MNDGTYRSHARLSGGREHANPGCARRKKRCEQAATPGIHESNTLLVADSYNWDGILKKYVRARNVGELLTRTISSGCSRGRKPAALRYLPCSSPSMSAT
jgi:hypothetical protein